MKLLVLSDSHGYTRRLTEALDAHPDARDVVFLGDGERDLEEVEWTYPDLSLIHISFCPSRQSIWE